MTAGASMTAMRRMVLPHSKNIFRQGGGRAHWNSLLKADHSQYDKRAWLPVIRGPAYTSGFSVSGVVRRIEYALEFKNASISSRPYVWDLDTRGFADPTWSGHVGFRPDAAWRLGASASHGPYLISHPGLPAALPPGQNRDDYKQFTLVFDAA